jgi:DNA helicase-2/ATP-dependent DNA helicase PcrA
VFHQKFGYGEVLAVDDNKLDVEFATGRKRVLSSFVEKA